MSLCRKKAPCLARGQAGRDSDDIRNLPEKEERVNPPALFDYQEQAVAWLASRRRGLVQAPAGSGKTIMAAAAIARVIGRRQRDRKVRVGWVANTREQLEQAQAAIALFPILADAAEFTICCPAGAPNPFVADVLVIDEGHHGPAATWRAIIEGHQECLWIFSATPFGDDEDRNAALRGFVENQVYVVDRESVRGRVLPAHVILLADTDTGISGKIDSEIERQMERRARYSKAAPDELYRQTASHVALTLGVIQNRARNTAIERTAQAHGGDSTLILVPTIKHGAALSSRLPGSVLCYSGMGAKNRRLAMAAFRSGELRCMIATSLADEGFDCPCANVLIMAGAGRSAARAEQRTGRVLRAHEGKTHGTIYDFRDLQHPLLTRQSLARQAVYRRLKYSVRNGQVEVANPSLA